MNHVLQKSRENQKTREMGSKSDVFFTSEGLYNKVFIVFIFNLSPLDGVHMSFWENKVNRKPNWAS